MGEEGRVVSKRCACGFRYVVGDRSVELSYFLQQSGHLTEY